MEFFMWMDDNNRTRVLILLNKWWTEGIFPEDKMQAYIASIYIKKGTPKNENYRPISLLTSIYKVYTSLLQKRIADAVDDDIFDTQFGFRKKNTVIPIGCIKRILEQAEATQNPCFMVFLDWKKRLTVLNRTNSLNLYSEWISPKCISKQSKASTQTHNSL